MKLLFTPVFLILCCIRLSAQNGLEQVIVEKYYVSDVNDTTVDGDGGVLPVNSVTYRVFIDMLPGYIFQAAYGTPEHELKLATTTTFFNNEDRGGKFPTYSRSQAQNNTVMLDSWLSVGAALKDYAGVLKADDDGFNTIQNADGVLQNVHAAAGIPLTAQDGAADGPIEPVTVVGFFDTDLGVLEDANDATAPTTISTHDGAWSSLNGSMGRDSAENKVLIGQFTTDGIFTFELNLQIRNQQTLSVEKYVARNAQENETLFPSLVHIDSLGLESATQDLVKLNQEVQVFPNPVTSQFTINIDKQFSLTQSDNRYILNDMHGAVVWSGKISSHSTQVDTKHQLTPGVYTLVLELENKYLFTRQVIFVH